MESNVFEEQAHFAPPKPSMEQTVFKWLVATWLVATIIQTVSLGMLGLWVVLRMLIRLSI